MQKSHLVGPGPLIQALDLHDWAASTGRAMASNLAHTARALAENPLPAPPS
ncbi:hypothetical protein ABZ478_35120 [Streptomyces sp. NPDC005706]|uniref:hypothetical protein n=1 Tax=Streptomyces sp. NPDC005706 TaxID=3157169 RepID=UPI0033CED72C